MVLDGGLRTNDEAFHNRGDENLGKKLRAKILFPGKVISRL
jgi:hypothetical protein